MHRLRKRLTQYYASEGKDQPVQIVIPEGKYVPQFVARRELPTATAKETLPIEVLPPARPIQSRSPRWWLAIGGIAAIAASLIFLVTYRRETTVSSSDNIRFPLLTGPQSEVRILAGRKTDFIDDRGQKWSADQFFLEGESNTDPHPAVDGTTVPEIFASQREGNFQYHIPLNAGIYELRLYFAETMVGEGNPAGGAESSRLFSVHANGAPLLEGFDVLADAPGPRRADIRVFRNIRPAEDGKLHLVFRSSKDSAFVNAIEVRQTPTSKIRPVRMVAQRLPVRDGPGRAWDPDDFVRGGSVVKRTRAVENTETPELFYGERFGTFSYQIPVAVDGTYKVTLYMHEAWFGPENFGKGGSGSRVFNIHMNHQPVLSDFDLFKASGGPLRAFVKTINGVKPNARGKLVIDFEPLRNYACINAIEIEEQ